jgi:hypothetical protein
MESDCRFSKPLTVKGRESRFLAGCEPAGDGKTIGVITNPP